MDSEPAPSRVLAARGIARQISAEEKAMVKAIAAGERAAGADPVLHIERMCEDTKKRLLEGAKQYKAAPVDAKAEVERCRARALKCLSDGLGDRYTAERLSLDRYEVYHADQRAIVERVRTVAEGLPDQVKQGAGLIWYGTVGTGKDHLMGWLLYQAAGRYGLECRWEFGLDLYGRLRDRMDEGRSEEDLLQSLGKPHILAISDPIPPAGNLSAFRVEFLHRLIDRRYRSLKSTWVTMNAMSPEDADEQLSAQVFDRLRESAEMFPCFWPSFRERRRVGA